MTNQQLSDALRILVLRGAIGPRTSRPGPSGLLSDTTTINVMDLADSLSVVHPLTDSPEQK